MNPLPESVFFTPKNLSLRINLPFFNERKMKYLFLFLLLAPLCLRLSAQTEPAKKPTIFEKLTAAEGMELTLEADLTTFIAQKRTNAYMSGKLTTKEGKIYTVEIRPRGRYRRKVSQNPPMKIRFSEKELAAEGLDTLNEIKIAVPAFDSDLGNELIVKEYLAYRMFTKVSDAHFRTGLVKLTLRDNNEKTPGKKVMSAIFIEDEEEVAARLGSAPEEGYGIPMEQYDTQQAAHVAMFQYLIGNTDWDFSMHRNVQLFKMKKDGKIMVVPYDFDFSGFVAAPYASPNSDSGLKSVRDRYLMSTDLNADALKAAVKLLKTKEKELYQVCRSKFLPKSVANEASKFLEIYFQKMAGKDEAPKTMPFDKE